MGLTLLPTLNAALNATAALAILTGYLAIRRRRVSLHRAAMLTAFGVSTLFLVSYVVCHLQAGSSALTAQFARHARIARWTLPLWFYVSVTGVVVYWMLYHG